jgi:hypothetical protein
MRRLFWVLPSLILLVGSATLAQNSPTKSTLVKSPLTLQCGELSLGFCPDVYKQTNYEGKYIGHDEPSVFFYSKGAGAGNAMKYRLTLPTDPATLPNQQGTGGTFNFQLHVAFWFGMDLCDSESAPEFTKECEPDSDENIFDDPDPSSPRYIGKHPGGAFLELQFYPPGWVDSPFLADPAQYFVAANAFSFNADQNSGAINNTDCLNKVGLEPVNSAVITLNGIPLFPANPLGVNFGNSNPDLTNVLLMNPGDTVIVAMHDTPDGLRIDVRDVSTGASGFMVLGPGSGFGHVIFDPNATTCAVAPYAFHPMYSTSSEHTRVSWTEHSYNIAFADEIGHFEFCNAFDPTTFNCVVPGVDDPTLDADDTICFNPELFGFTAPPFVDVIGCVNSESDYDGASYQTVWPGTDVDDAALHPGPVRFTSPVFRRRGQDGDEGEWRNYERIAFETNIPGNEFPVCNIITGQNCVNPPPGAKFYPIFSTARTEDGACAWQIGGTQIPGTRNTFGGSSQTEFGPLLVLHFPGPLPNGLILNYRRVLDENPCEAPTD